MLGYDWDPVLVGGIMRKVVGMPFNRHAGGRQCVRQGPPEVAIGEEDGAHAARS